MKKVFCFYDEKRNPERILESIKYEIRKYLKRERNKKLPEGAPFWIFECRFGQSAEEAALVYVQDLIAALDNAYAQKWEECYIEIIAKPAKNLKPTKEAN